MFFSDIPRIPESSHPPLESSEYALFVPLTELDLVLSTVIFCYEFLECLPCTGRFGMQPCIILRFLCEKKSLLSESCVFNQTYIV